MKHHSNGIMKSMNHRKSCEAVLHSNRNISIGGHEINEPIKYDEENACEVVEIVFLMYLDQMIKSEQDAYQIDGDPQQVEDVMPVNSQG